MMKVKVKIKQSPKYHFGNDDVPPLDTSLLLLTLLRHLKGAIVAIEKLLQREGKNE